MLQLILKKISMKTKTAVSFANLLMSTVETEILNKNTENPLVCKRYIDDVFSLWNISLRIYMGSLNRLTDITQQKYQTKKPFS